MLFRTQFVSHGLLLPILLLLAGVGWAKAANPPTPPPAQLVFLSSTHLHQLPLSPLSLPSSTASSSTSASRPLPPTSGQGDDGVPKPKRIWTLTHPGDASGVLLDVASLHGAGASGGGGDYWLISELAAAGKSRLWLVRGTDAGAKSPPDQTELQVEGGLMRADHLSFDAATHTLFVADVKANNILALRLKDKNQQSLPPQVLMKLEGEQLRAMAHEPCNNHLFWSTSSRIERLSLDNRTREVVVEKDLNRVSSLSVDRWQRHLYWFDRAAGGGKKFCLSRSQLDGSERSVVCCGSGGVPSYMTVGRDDVFWSDWYNMVVWRLPKSSMAGGGGAEVVCSPVAAARSRSAKPMGLAVLDDAPLPLCDQPPTPLAITKSEADMSKTAVAQPTAATDQSCNNYCLNSGQCRVSSGSPTCLCPRGFSGRRCQTDVCFNFCLNDEACVVKDDGRPACRCDQGTNGTRCQESIRLGAGHNETFAIPLKSSSASSNFPLFALLTFLVIFSFVSVVVIVLLRRKIKRLVAAQKKHQLEKKAESVASNGDVVVVRRQRSKSRTFSGGRRSSSSAATAAAASSSCDGQGGCGDQNGSCLNGGGSGRDQQAGESRVVIDLEDCCQMTICDRPCVEASFRKATHRKKRLFSSSSGADKSADADKQTLLENDALSEDRDLI